uniref:Putative nuclease HARBI1 n=1 Tax=Cacopsylla melanoneura TaxID=428564 RepID=A0A8D8T1Z5_9HEMI
MDMLGLMGMEDGEEAPVFQVQPRRQVYRERINFEARYDFTFNERFRIPRPVFIQRHQDNRGELEPRTNRSRSLNAEEQILLTLHWLGTGAQQHAIGDMHGVSKATVGRVAEKVIATINNTLFDEVVRWPDDMVSVIGKFHDVAGMPTVVGCVDGTLINIDAPVENEEQFVDRHGAHSINCMACVGPDRQFFNVSACWPGSVHDARVLRRSNMCADFEEGWRPYPNGIILGDSAYPLKPWLLTPLFRNLEDNAVRRYNKAHKSTRSIVENAFGILKEKFPILNHMRVEPRYAGEIFKCCTVLCNLSKRLEDLPPYVPQGEGRGEEDQDEEEPNEHEGNAVGRAQGELRLQQILQHFR